MAIKALQFDAREVGLSIRADALPACPFCGQKRPLVSSSINHHAAGGEVLYQCRIRCNNLDCNATVSYNATSREYAQDGVVLAWRRRNGL